jgi:hypothetical protein
VHLVEELWQSLDLVNDGDRTPPSVPPPNDQARG